MGREKEMKLAELTAWLDRYLEAERFSDYAPNGLQVEGKADVRRIVTAVTASRAAIEYAVSVGADALLVHHGWFWKGEPAPVVGMKAKRMRLMMKADMSLVAYHLPLDAHPEVGNNALLAKMLGITLETRSGFYDLLHVGTLAEPVPARVFARRVAEALGREPQLFGDGERMVRRIGWCSGAAQGELSAAAAQGADLYLSGEISERTWHEAREEDVPYLACGHHATECCGIKALGELLAETFPELEVSFYDDRNPA